MATTAAGGVVTGMAGAGVVAGVAVISIVTAIGAAVSAAVTGIGTVMVGVTVITRPLARTTAEVMLDQGIASA